MLTMDRLGRKNNFLLSAVPMLLSGILIYFSYVSPLLIYIARLMGGIGMGWIMSVLPVYVSEISRPSIRGKLGVIPVAMYTFGIVAVNLAGNYLSMYHLALVVIGICFIFLATFVGMPDSPYLLLMYDRQDGAEKSLNFFRRTRNVQRELFSLEKDVKRQISEGTHYKNLFTVYSNRKALMLMVFARIFQQLTGTTAFTMYNQELLQDSKDILEPQFGVFIISFIQVLMGFVSGNLSDRFGRIPLMVYSSASCCVCLILTGSYFTIRDFSTISLPSWFPLVLLTLFFMVFQIGIGALVAVILGEIFSASIKPKAICVVNMTFSGTVLLTTKFFQVSRDYIHISVAFYGFALFSLLGAISFKVFYPETKGKTLEEIQMSLKSDNREKSENSTIEK
ncbi:hypothetical protein WA026_011191 [Henosepilachna vigintioctopunctata]